MQPYFLPYVGYFQLINQVDCFVIYDDIQFSKKSWVNRNRILINGQESLLSIPLKKASDYLDISERNIAEVFDWKKMYRQFEMGYKKSPNWNMYSMVLEELLACENTALFGYVNNSVNQICHSLGITTKIVKSSELKIDRDLKGKDRVIATCKILRANTYINPIGGMSLYDYEEFSKSGLELNFLKSNLSPYAQINVEKFVPALSIMDMMFNCSEDVVSKLINTDFEIINDV